LNAHILLLVAVAIARCRRRRRCRQSHRCFIPQVAQQGKALAQTIHNFADQLEQLAKEIESTPASAYANGTAVLPNFGVAVNGVLASGSVETKKRKRGDKEKKIKDPNAPKRPPSAYLLYQNQIRHQMKEKYPELPYKEMLGKIADSWGQLGDKEKKVCALVYCWKRHFVDHNTLA